MRNKNKRKIVSTKLINYAAWSTLNKHSQRRKQTHVSISMKPEEINLQWTTERQREGEIWRRWVSCVKEINWIWPWHASKYQPQPSGVRKLSQGVVEVKGSPHRPPSYLTLNGLVSFFLVSSDGNVQIDQFSSFSYLSELSLIALPLAVLRNQNYWCLTWPKRAQGWYFFLLPLLTV